MASYKYCIGDAYVLQVCSNWNNVPTSWLFPEPQDSVLRDLDVHKVCSVHVYIHIVLNDFILGNVQPKFQSKLSIQLVAILKSTVLNAYMEWMLS